MKNSTASVLGFTLIELLVVVLIIGILAAVAVPQYQVAVAKSRSLQAMTLMDKLWEAQQVYFMEHGVYADKLSDLVLEVPNGYTSLSDTTAVYKWGACTLNERKEGFCRVVNGPIFIRSWKKTARYCFAYPAQDSGALQRKVCLGFGGVRGPDGGDHERYDLPS